jgi:putative hydrolase of the HAD superfamily
MALGGVVSLDALGTLVALEPPAPLLARALGERGVAVSEEQAAAAMTAEMAYYRSHHATAFDAPSLARLRARCAAVVGGALARAGADTSGLAPGELLAALLVSLRFRPYPEVPAALAALRDAGWRRVVVSNWDVSLHEMLAATGLRDLVDGAISSAEAGAAKPSPAIFERALALVAGGRAGGALHVGDSPAHDVAGALAAGLRPVLVARGGERPALPDGVSVVASLAELPALLPNLNADRT